jgi:predicted tellurium resistance membrane protein TerC
VFTAFTSYAFASYPVQPSSVEGALGIIQWPFWLAVGQVWVVTTADTVMSLDNIISIAAAAETAAMRVDAANPLTMQITVIVFGLAISVPLIIAGSTLLMKAMEIDPILIWVGAAVLGWIAGELIVTDAAVLPYLRADFTDEVNLWGAIAGAIFVIAVGWLARGTKRKAGPNTR